MPRAFRSQVQPNGVVVVVGPRCSGKSTWIRQRYGHLLDARMAMLVDVRTTHVGLDDYVWLRKACKSGLTLIVEGTDQASALRVAKAI